MARPDLILASSSPWRRELLERLKMPFRCISPDVLETPRPGECAREMARRLALLKANHVADNEPDCVVIGSDQTCTLDGEPLRKPKRLDVARRQLLRAADQTLVFHTAVAVVYRPEGIQIVDSVKIDAHLRPLREDEVERYLELEPALNCVGAFRAEALGISLFESINSTDPTALTGLPLITTAALLRQVGLNPLG